MATPQGYTHWAQAQGLTVLILALWFVFSIAFHLFVSTLHLGEFHGLPISFLIAGNAWFASLVGMVVWFCRRQYQIDRLSRVEAE